MNSGIGLVFILVMIYMLDNYKIKNKELFLVICLNVFVILYNCVNFNVVDKLIYNLGELFFPEFINVVVVKFLFLIIVSLINLLVLV